jgi:hypothetical protein
MEIAVVAPLAHVERGTAVVSNSTRPVGAAVVTTAEATATVTVKPELRRRRAGTR